MRNAEIVRNTTETRIKANIGLDGTGWCELHSGVGFLDHMLEQLVRHSSIDLSLEATGDTHVDDHHTTEDVGIVLGSALSKALGDKRGINRYGQCSLPMDDAWIDVALDLSGRHYLGWDVTFPTQKIGRFDTELIREFFRAFSAHGKITLHISKRCGDNSHHIAEAIFKGVARSLRTAISAPSENLDQIPSTKGML